MQLTRRNDNLARWAAGCSPWAGCGELTLDACHPLRRKSAQRASQTTAPPFGSVFRATLLGGILSTSAFCSGQAYRAGLQQRIHVRPFVVHTPHPGTGAAAKKFVLRELGLWRVRRGCGTWFTPVHGMVLRLQRHTLSPSESSEPTLTDCVLWKSLAPFAMGWSGRT